MVDCGGVVRMDIDTVSRAFASHVVCYTKGVVQCIFAHAMPELIPG